MSRDEYQKELNQVYDLSKARDGYTWGQCQTAEEIKGMIKHFQNADRIAR